MVLRFIAVLPFNFVRVALFRNILRYRIGKKVRIGFGTYIYAKKVRIEDCVSLQGMNRFTHLDELIIKEGASIGPRNRFEGDDFSIGRHSRPNYLEIGKKVRISTEHLLDASFGIIIGDETKIVGRSCNFWSHGSTRPNDTIVVGSGCRFGANCNIGTGVVIKDNCLIGMGSVLINSITESECVVAGVPAKIVKKNYNWNEHWW